MYHIFISHACNYSDAYNTVVKWLNEAQAEGKLTWTNYSVPEHDPVDANNTKKLQAALDSQIKPASKVIIISGMYAAYSEWINYEIDRAVSYGKKIIGLRPWGQERVPAKITDNATVMVGWNKTSLINAITND